MSVMVLITTLYGFGLVNDSARRINANAELTDLASRVSLAVQEAVVVASARNESSEANSTLLLFERTLSVPTQIQGLDYNITLDASYVNGSIAARNVQVSQATLNATASLPPTAALCTTVYTLCEVTGYSRGANGRIVISYLFNGTAVPVQNELSIR